jgi:glycosyltransferase involved in cell wall biosynthesis
MKIFMGIHEIANLIKDFSETLSAAGYDVETLSYPRHRFFEHNRYTYTLKIPPGFKQSQYIRFLYPLLVLPFYLPLVFKFDVFVFVWTETFLPLNLDLFLLKLMGKKVIIFNCGSDVRYRPIQYRLDTEVLGLNRFKDSTFEKSYVQNSSTFTRTFFSQKVEEWAGCQIVSLRDQATFQKKDYHFFHFPTPPMVDRPRPASATPLIIHAPSDRILKGTEYVLAAIERLKNEGLKFEFELIENKEHAYVLSRLRQADIVVDEPGVWVGRLSVESLAAGCVVIGSNNPAYIGLAEADSPVIPFKPDAQQLAEILKELILNKPKRQELMNKSYDYWANHYSPAAFVAYFEDLLAGRAKKFSALPHHRDLLLRFALDSYQRLLIRLFY